MASVRKLPVVAELLDQYEERFSDRGRFLLWAVMWFAILGLDTRRTQNYRVFAVAAGLLLSALLLSFWRRPRARLECLLPTRATAGRALSLEVRVTGTGERADDLMVSFPRLRRYATSLDVEPRQAFTRATAERPASLRFSLLPRRRGRYPLRPPVLRSCDPLRLLAGPAAESGEQALLVNPRFFSFDELHIPVGRRYQPGGIPLSSSTGDALEFVGTRDYREGDPLKNIHWRSWARRGEPVVKEYQEEYFCRLALVLDTSQPKRPTPEDERRFEAAVSLLASIADHFSRGEYVVDVLAAGPDLFRVSAGRGLASQDHVLEVLAALEPSHEAPFKVVQPALVDALSQLSTVVAVLQDWDEPRETFLKQVRALGTAVRAFVVRDGPTTRPVASSSEPMSEISTLSPREIEERIVAEERAGRS